MEPMKAPAAESPANLTRQTRGGLDGLVVTRVSEVKLSPGSGMFSISESQSESESEFLGFVGVDILYQKQYKPNIRPIQGSRLFATELTVR